MILIIDNYDSFVHNLARYFRQLTNETVSTVRNDSISHDDFENVSAIVISPGPCGPAQAGKSLEIVRHFCNTIPILGVCLGHQVIIEAFGGNVKQIDHPIHGKASEVFHESNSLLFKKVPTPFTAGRYHSLIADTKTLPDELEPIGFTKERIIMAVQHKKHVCYGVQFHPESVLTKHGYQIVENFLSVADIPMKPSSRAIMS